MKKTSRDIARKRGYAVNPAREIAEKEAKRLTRHLKKHSDVVWDAIDNALLAEMMIVFIVTSILGASAFVMLGGLGTVVSLGLLAVTTAAGTAISFKVHGKRQRRTRELLANETVVPLAENKDIAVTRERLLITVADSITSDIIRDLNHLEWDNSLLAYQRRQVEKALTVEGLPDSETTALLRSKVEMGKATRRVEKRILELKLSVYGLPTTNGDVANIALAEKAAQRAREITDSTAGTESLPLSQAYREAFNSNEQPAISS